jgi:phosphoglycerate kinase
MSLAPIADALSEIMGGKPIGFSIDCVGEQVKESVKQMKNGDVLLLENLRFHAGEETNNSHFVEQLASFGDIFVNDTFSCSHRKHASIVGLAHKLPSAAGLLLQEEIHSLERVLGNAVLPMAAIVGGSKVSTKIGLLRALMDKVEVMFIGGAMANTLLKARGYAIGRSLFEEEYIDTAKEVLAMAEKKNCEIMLPEQVVVARSLGDFVSTQVVPVSDVPADSMILDVGPESIEQLSQRLNTVETVVWNGPLGAFEYRPFDVGSVSAARAIANLSLQGKIISVAGGGDVVASLKIAGLMESFTYVSTAGGAFLEWLEGRVLPGIAPLIDK